MADNRDFRVLFKGVFMDIGTKLKSLRTQNGLTQQELADRAELTKGFISQSSETLPRHPSVPSRISCSVLAAASGVFYR